MPPIVESKPLSKLERKIARHDESIRTLFDVIRQLMAPPERSRRSIGFRVEEGRPPDGRPRGVGRETAKRLGRA
jgi:hypothetical protein